MQDHTTYPDPSAEAPAACGNGASHAPAYATEPYVHPTIPLGLPNVVQFVEASLHHLPMPVRFVADRLSRYANAKGEVSMAASFLCQITGLGSRNTADHHLRLIESLGVLEKKPGKGGKDRKSNAYVFLGEERNWQPLPTERPGTDPWVALARSRRENEALQGEIEELRAELARLMNGAAIAHPGVSDGDGVPPPQQAAHSYETAGPGRSSEESGAIAHSELSNGPDTTPPQEASHSYETAGPGSPPRESGAIARSELSNGPDTTPPQEASHSYETAGPGGSPRESGAIARSELSNGPDTTLPQEASHSYETAGPGGSPRQSGAIAHSELSNGSEEAQEYLSRRARVEALVLAHRGYYDRSFDRRGVLGAIEFFSRSAENEQELLRQAAILDAGQDPARTSGAAPPPAQGPAPPVNRETGRREVEFCPDCSSPYTTFNGEVRCPGCTGRRRRESEA